jgi:copper chaperone CopZ
MMKKTELKIDGMRCEKCVKQVKDALEEIPDVQAAQVSLEENKARIEHGDGVSAETLKAAVIAAGFGVSA